ncbi:MAG: ABC transporter permease [Rhodomicrobium sp.]
MMPLLRAFRTELWRIWTDPGASSSMVLAVLIYAVFYPQPYLNEAVRRVPVIVVDQDDSTSSRELIRRIDATDGAAVVASATDMQAARDAFFARKVSAIVVVPVDFERDLLAGRQSPIAAYGDGGYFLIYRQVMGAIRAAAGSLGTEVATKRLVAAGSDPASARAQADPMPATLIPLFNPQGGYASYVVPAAFVLILQQTLLVGIGVLGTAARSPAAEDGESDGIASLFGKVLAYAALYSVWFYLYLVIMPYWYHLPRLGSVADLMLLGLPFVLATSFLGLTLANLLPSRESVVLALVALGLPLFFLSGISWPYEAQPENIRLLSQFIPSTSAMRGLVRIGQMGASLADVRHEWIVLWALTGLYGATALIGQWRRRSAV